MDKYYLNYKDNVCIGSSRVKLINDEIECREVSKEEYDKYQVQQDEKQVRIKQINELKSYLASTDYICNKLTEALALGNITKLEELKIKYVKELTKREEARSLIDELDKLITY